ncbi:MAG: hypothetical protein AAGC55_20135, partial [Myxococcota bacterium]
DGLSDYLDGPDHLLRLLDAQAFEHSAEHLIDFANNAGGRDNITAVVVRIDDASSHCGRVKQRTTASGGLSGDELRHNAPRFAAALMPIMSSL